MQTRTFSGLETLLAFLIGFAIAMFVHSYLVPRSVTERNAVPLIESVAVFDARGVVSIGLPTRLRIPKIGVNSVIEYMGLTVDGAMDTPTSPDRVGWFALGTHPGNVGNAVMAGHYGWKNGIPAVFDNLNTLRKGDLLYVDDEKGVTVIFVVRESRTYDQADGASEVFLSSNGGSHLNLITCQGVWNKDMKSYSHRLVIFTDKKE